ncbi:MAG: N-acetylneuraminate lyase, partial [Clostridiales bacterium]|nr:N-acetylneuraminate lyase [Clostridiales bacterium]
LPELFLKVWGLFYAGKVAEAAAVQNDICRIIYKMCSAHGNLYAVVKAILKKHGCDIGSVRKPLPALIDSDLTVVDEASAMIDAAIAK